MDEQEDIELRGLLLYELGVKVAAARGLESEPELLQRIRADLKSRSDGLAADRALMHSRLSRGEASLTNWLLLPVPLPGGWAFPLTGWMCVLLAVAVWFAVSLPLALLILGAGLAVVTCLLWGDARRRARFNALSGPRCRCGYSLKGAVDALPPELVGASVGPRRCPECGVLWPRFR